MASASTMDSSQLLVERDEVDMQIEREAEGQINIKELESYLNSTIIECKTRIAFSSQAKALIAKLSKAEAVIANQSKAKEILEQKLEEMNGKIHCASIENSTLKNENDQFNKEIQELMEIADKLSTDSVLNNFYIAFCKIFLPIQYFHLTNHL